VQSESVSQPLEAVGANAAVATLNLARKDSQFPSSSQLKMPTIKNPAKQARIMLHLDEQTCKSSAKRDTDG